MFSMSTKIQRFYIRYYKHASSSMVVWLCTANLKMRQDWIKIRHKQNYKSTSSNMFPVIVDIPFRALSTFVIKLLHPAYSYELWLIMWNLKFIGPCVEFSYTDILGCNIIQYCLAIEKFLMDLGKGLDGLKSITHNLL